MHDSRQFERSVDELARRGVDGVFCTVHHWLSGDYEYLLQRHPNTVFYEDPGIAGVPHVSVDRREAVRLAVRHLAKRGRRRIALALATLTRATHIARLEGYREEFAAGGLLFDDLLIFNGEKYGLAFASIDEETGLWNFPEHVISYAIEKLVVEGGADAIIVHDDFWAATMLRQLRQRGFRVPEDIAIVGYLNHYLCDWTDPPLTTISLEHQTAAARMVEILEQMIGGGPLPETRRNVLICPRLLVRKST